MGPGPPGFTGGHVYGYSGEIDLIVPHRVYEQAWHFYWLFVLEVKAEGNLYPPLVL